MRTKLTYHEQLQNLVHRYRDENRITGPIQMKDVAHWGLRLGLIKPPVLDAVKLIARDLAKAERDEYFVDEQGRRVRWNHRVKEEQGSFWVEIDKATPEQMGNATQLRREGIRHDCIQLDADTASWNDNHRPEDAAEIQTSFDFSEDVIEARESTTYSETRPCDDEDEFD